MAIVDNNNFQYVDWSVFQEELPIYKNQLRHAFNQTADNVTPEEFLDEVATRYPKEYKNDFFRQVALGWLNNEN